jgi:hypothetical protein
MNYAPGNFLSAVWNASRRLLRVARGIGLALSGLEVPAMRIVLSAVLFASVFAVGCTEPTSPSQVNVPVRIDSEPGANRSPVPVSGPARMNDHHMGTHLTGAEEFPDPRDTDAQGQATFQINDEGTAISYKLNVANIENVRQAHIHLAPAGSNGDIVAWLYPAAPPQVLIPGRTQGTLGEGELTAASLVGPLAGQPLSALIDAMRNGGTYVNVHTSQFPPGEIRGQID